MLFAGCSNEDESFSVTADQPARSYLYGVKTIKTNQATRGIAQTSKLWYPNSYIKIKFLDGTSQMHEEVKTIASEWLNYAGINFKYVTDDKADVRIAFDQNIDRYVTWSYTGTDCRLISNQNEATMNFAFWNELTPEEKTGDVLRAFGQMLGLELEHRHIKIDPTWSNKIQSYWDIQLGDIPWDMLREHVFDPLDSTEIISTKDYDPASIMIWPFKIRGLVTYANEYTVPTEFNTRLSQTDKEFIANIYPKNEATILTINPDIIDTANEHYISEFNFSQMLSSNNTVIIDFGNGEIFEGLLKDAPTITYPQGQKYTIQIWAKDLGLQISGKNNATTKKNDILTLEKIFLSGNTQYSKLDLSYTALKEIEFNAVPDFSKITNWTYSFRYCMLLKSIPARLFDKAIDATSFLQTFHYCTSLENIPTGLFDKNPKITTFYGTFSNCTSLKEIPAGLFDKNTKASNFNYTFQACSSLESIPAGLFDKNTLIPNFNYTFKGCTSLESIPAGLFDFNINANNFYATFYLCSSLKNIPAGLFDKNTKVTSFNYTFYSCSSLISIPAGLFDKNTSVKEFINTFYGCTTLTSIPSGLFDKNTLVTNFSYTFIRCYALTSIPANLFSKNSKVTNFSYTFYNCRSVTSNFPTIWTSHPNANGSKCFWNCSKAANYASIPAAWKN